MSLRQMAKQLGIPPAYLSYMVNGKRPWRPDLEARYDQLVNTLVNTQPPSVNSESASNMAGRARDEFTMSASVAGLTLAGARGSRTHCPDRRAGANGFEVREAHRDPSAPARWRPPVQGGAGRTSRTRRDLGGRA